MKVLTAAEMREVDLRTIALGLPEVLLMENAGLRVVEFLQEKCAPIESHRMVVFCGKGSNGGDGLVIARQLHTRFRPRSLHVLCTEPEVDSPAMLALRACGVTVEREIAEPMLHATLIVDALLGTGQKGPARGLAAEWIQAINTRFPRAKVCAVDLPSGMQSDGGDSEGEIARAHYCVTFTAPKPCHVLGLNAERVGEWRVGEIGSPPWLLEGSLLNLVERTDVKRFVLPRPLDSNKGSYGHVLVVGGAEGKSGATEMTGLAALRSGAGLVTVASSASRMAHPELMTGVLPDTWEDLKSAGERMDVIALGPGLGSSSEHKQMTRDALMQCEKPMVVDADGLNVIAGWDWSGPPALRVLTPHPGEMSRLMSTSTAEVQKDRVGAARSFAKQTQAVVVLKGSRTVTAFPDGAAHINPTGSPGMATGGTGDILTGLIAGMLAQFPEETTGAILAAVYLHGLSGQLASSALTEQAMIATDILRFLPKAQRACADL